MAFVSGLALRARLVSIIPFIVITGAADWECTFIASHKELAFSRQPNIIPTDLTNVALHMIQRLWLLQQQTKEKPTQTSLSVHSVAHSFVWITLSLSLSESKAETKEGRKEGHSQSHTDPSFLHSIRECHWVWRKKERKMGEEGGKETQTLTPSLSGRITTSSFLLWEPATRPAFASIVYSKALYVHRSSKSPSSLETLVRKLRSLLIYSSDNTLRGTGWWFLLRWTSFLTHCATRSPVFLCVYTTTTPGSFLLKPSLLRVCPCRRDTTIFLSILSPPPPKTWPLTLPPKLPKGFTFKTKPKKDSHPTHTHSHPGSSSHPKPSFTATAASVPTAAVTPEEETTTTTTQKKKTTFLLNPCTLSLLAACYYYYYNYCQLKEELKKEKQQQQGSLTERKEDTETRKKGG